MSEYQYYEWQTLDRPLTPEERAAVNRLSSHIEVTSWQAVVTYSWGDFKHDPKAVVLLLKLRDLADYQGRTADFQVRVTSLQERYANRPVLRRRLQRARLMG